MTVKEKSCVSLNVLFFLMYQYTYIESKACSIYTLPTSVCLYECICVCTFVSSRERFIEVSNFQNIHVNFKNMLMHNISCGKIDHGPKNQYIIYGR